MGKTANAQDDKHARLNIPGQGEGFRIPAAVRSRERLRVRADTVDHIL
jgi:hypothetical protein